MSIRLIRVREKLSGETNTDYKDITDEKISINKNKQLYFHIDIIFKKRGNEVATGIYNPQSNE